MLRRIQSARDAFPASLAIATVLGVVYDQREEWAGALAAYDAVIAAVLRELAGFVLLAGMHAHRKLLRAERPRQL